MEETIKAIKRRFRLRMNGPVAASMREKGMNYRVNFGLNYPQIKEIAAGLQPDRALAGRLWEEDVRESKILSTLIYPPGEMSRSEADKWVKEIPYPEIADYAVMNLFVRLSFAPELMMESVRSGNPLVRYTGFMLASRLFSRGLALPPEWRDTWLDAACESCCNGPAFVGVAAMNGLERLVQADRTVVTALKNSLRWKDCETIRNFLDRSEETVG